MHTESYPHVGAEPINLTFVTGTLNKLGRHLALAVKRDLRNVLVPYGEHDLVRAPDFIRTKGGHELLQYRVWQEELSDQQKSVDEIKKRCTAKDHT